MTDLPLLRLADRASADLPAQLVKRLADGRWHLRESLARSLGVSVRKIRDAAHACKGEVVSSQQGLKLTQCCTSEEYQEFAGRFTSQIHEMTARVVQTAYVWQHRTQADATSPHNSRSSEQEQVVADENVSMPSAGAAADRAFA